MKLEQNEDILSTSSETVTSDMQKLDIFRLALYLGLVQSTGLLILIECSSFSMQTISDCFSMQTISNSIDRTMIEPSLLQMCDGVNVFTTSMGKVIR